MDRDQARQLGRTLAKSTAHVKVLIELFVGKGMFTPEEYEGWMDDEDRFLQGRPFSEVLRMVLGQEGEQVTEVPGKARDEHPEDEEVFGGGGLTYGEARGVLCETCGAEPGKPCVPVPEATTLPHFKRMTAARAKKGG